MLKTVLQLVTIFVLALAASMTFQSRVQADDLQAFASLVNSNGDLVGQAKFVELGSGNVRVTVDVSGLRPGFHGMHIHSVGSCLPSDFMSAGSHFNPANRKHGLQTSEGPHAGDLPNLLVKSDGSAHFEMVVARFTLSPGATSLFDADRSAIVIHADTDDGITDPTGNSGARVTCGVVTLGLPPAVPASASALQIAPIIPPATGDAGIRLGDACSEFECVCCCCE